MRLKYFTCDVFTDRRFGGNQLAVLPEADGLSDVQMQQIAREFNFSETTFVLPPEKGGTCRVRIFTPMSEVPFAGHPNIGTAFVLAAAGRFGEFDTEITVGFEEEAGLVPVSIHKRAGGGIWCELTAPERLSLGATVSTELAASAVSLAPADIVTSTHAPCVASVGLPFLFVECRDRNALERARPNIAAFEALLTAGIDTPYVHLYTRQGAVTAGAAAAGAPIAGATKPRDAAAGDPDTFDIRARMFSPTDGIPEDPATGSANCALVALLTHNDAAQSGGFSWRIAQGVEMGRPSVLDARTQKIDGVVVNAWIGGESVLVSEGHLL